MALQLWPFNKGSEIEKQTPEEIALTVAYGTDLGQAYSDTSEQDSSLQNYADFVSQNAIAFACIREIATSISSIELNAIKETVRGEYEEYNGPLADILKTPNPDQSQVDFLESIVEQYLTYGNVYIYFDRQGRGGASGPIKNLYLLRPDKITIKVNKTQGIESYVYSGDGSSGIKIDPSDIAHLKYPNNTSGAKTNLLYGLSPMAIIKPDVVSDSLLSTLNQNFLKRGAVPTGLLKMTKRGTQESVDEARRKFASTFAGKRGQFNVAVLDSDTSYEPLQVMPRDLALEETRDELVSRICSVLGVAPIIIGANIGLRRSTYSNYRQAMSAYRDETVAPLMNRIVRFWNLKITPNFTTDAYVEADYKNAPAWQENEEVLANRTINLYQSGITSLNEAREALGYDSINGGEIRRSPSNAFEVNVGDSQPVLNAPNPEKILQLDSEKQSLEVPPPPPIETPSSGPIPIPRAQELLAITRRDEQQAVDKLAKELRQKYFKPIQSRIGGYVGRRLNDETIYKKEEGYPFTASDLVPTGMENDLATILEASALGVLASTFAKYSASGIVPTAELNERGKYAQQAIQQAGRDAQYIQQTTFKNVQRTLEFGLQNGLTVDQIAQGGFLDDGTPFKGLKGMMIDADTNRAALIARTEIANATRYSQLQYYSDIGSNDVMLIDGDQFDQRCIERNGKVMKLEAAATQTEHPNGILDFVPAIDRNSNIDALIARLDQQIDQRKNKEEITP